MSDLSENLVAHYKMDDNAASTVVLDSSGNDYHGTSQRNTSVIHAAGKVGGAFSFNGESDYITIPDCLDWMVDNPNNGSAISFLVKANEGHPVAAQYIFGKQDVYDASPPDYWYTKLECSITPSGQLYFNLTTESNNNFSCTINNVFSAGENDWKHIVIVLAYAYVPEVYTDLTVYVDGVQNYYHRFSEEINEFHPPANWMAIGCKVTQTEQYGEFSYGNFLDGSIDNFVTVSKALSAAEVLQLYNEANSNNRGTIYTTDNNSIYGTDSNSIFGGAKSIYKG